MKHLIIILILGYTSFSYAGGLPPACNTDVVDSREFDLRDIFDGHVFFIDPQEKILVEKTAGCGLRMKVKMDVREPIADLNLITFLVLRDGADKSHLKMIYFNEGNDTWRGRQFTVYFNQMSRLAFVVRGKNGSHFLEETFPIRLTSWD